MGEAMTISSLERQYLRHNRRATFLALEELDFTWDLDEVKEFKKLWKRGADFRLIAEHFNRDPDEVAILIMDLARRGKIKPRGMGLFTKFNWD